MNNKDFIIKYNNVEYSIHPAFDTAIDPKSQVEIANSKPNCNYIAYYRGARDVIDLRYAKKEDHIHLIFNDKSNNGLGSVKDIYLNSENLNNTHIHADKQLDAILHINDNHCSIDESRFKITPNNNRYLSDLASFLSTLKTENDQPIFKKISFENNSYKLATSIKAICDQNNIQSYGMESDETGHKGYITAASAHKAIQIVKDKPLSKINIKTTKIKLTVENDKGTNLSL